MKSVLNGLGLSTSNQNIASTEENKPTFVDPGYNDDPSAHMSNFLQKNSNPNKAKTENKRVIIGPGQSKPKVPVSEPKVENMNNELLGLDLLGSSNPQPNSQ